MQGTFKILQDIEDMQDLLEGKERAWAEYVRLRFEAAKAGERASKAWQAYDKIRLTIERLEQDAKRVNTPEKT